MPLPLSEQLRDKIADTSCLSRSGVIQYLTNLSAVNMRVLLILFMAVTLLEASADDSHGHSSEKRGRIKPQLRQLPDQDIGDEITAAPFPMHRSYLPVKV